MTELDKLIEAVEAGYDEESKSLIRRLGVMDVIDPDQHGWAISAYRGSLDAAKALHDALLPGWPIQLVDRSPDWLGGGGWKAAVNWPHIPLPSRKPFYGPRSYRFDAIGPDPARAWLLAILRAYRATLTKGSTDDRT